MDTDDVLLPGKGKDANSGGINGVSGNNGATAVVLWMRDGTEREEVFATRFQAEMFVFLLPYLATTLPDDAENGVAAAMISPLVEEVLQGHGPS